MKRCGFGVSDCDVSTHAMTKEESNVDWKSPTTEAPKTTKILTFNLPTSASSHSLSLEVNIINTRQLKEKEVDGHSRDISISSPVQ
jgi:hypothetical protein